MKNLKVPALLAVVVCGSAIALASGALSHALAAADPAMPVAPAAKDAAAAPAGAAAPGAADPAVAAAAAGLAVPAVPLGVAMTANSADSVTLTWFRPTGDPPTSYNVFAGASKEGPFTRIATVKERTVTETKLPAATTRFYRVSASNALGESAQSPVAEGFTIRPAAAAVFPARVAKNMCVTLGATVVSDAPPLAGKLSYLTDGLDSTTCRLRKNSEIKLKLNAEISIADAAYLMLHFRTHGTAAEWSNNPFARVLSNYVITESLDSTDGKDGTWQELAAGTNDLLDSVIVLPNHKPKWIGVKSSGTPAIPADDKRLMPSDLMLSRLDVFRAAPKGYRNDYWIFTGDSLIVQDMPAGGVEGRNVYFSDLVRQRHPDRYPIVVHAGRGGEIMANTTGRMKNFLPIISAPNGTDTATATMLCFEPGFNDIGIMAGLWIGEKVQKNLMDAQEVCKASGLVMVPVRIEYATAYLNPETMEPAKGTIFHNTLAANLAGVDVFAREHAPYAVDPKTQLPYADYWNYTHQNYATAIAKDGVHHTKAGSDGINQLWADVADKMVYSRQN